MTDKLKDLLEAVPHKQRLTMLGAAIGCTASADDLVEERTCGYCNAEIPRASGPAYWRGYLFCSCDHKMKFICEKGGWPAEDSND
jgi:hypothetical protein